jgi:CBS domain containing-hemolysin-like protein
MRKPYFVQENDLISLILKQMQANKIHLAIVLDEFNGTSGVVSLEDILEELVGEIQDEYDEEMPQFKKVDESTFITIATLPINDLNDLLPIPLPESEDYETLNGLIITELGRIPNLGEKFVINEYIFEILKSTDRMIEQVSIKLKTEAVPSD